MRRRYTAAERQQLLADLARSKMTQVAFAKQRGVNVQTLRSWLHQARHAATGAKVAFLEVQGPDDAGAPRFEVALVGGPTLRFAAALDPTWLAQLLTALC